MSFLDNVRESLGRLARWVDARTGGAFTVLGRALKRYGQTQAGQAAAGLAYYLFFSLFPLLLVLVGAATYIWNLESTAALQQAANFISQAIPVSRALIVDNLETVVQARGTVTIVGLIGALWSASNAFTIVSQNINEAWQSTGERGFIQKRLVAFAMIGVLILLLVLSLASSAVGGLLPSTQATNPALQFLKTELFVLLTRLLPIVFSIVIFLAMYRWIPMKRVSWRAAIWGAVVAGAGWEALKGLFTYYLGSGLANYQVVYGSLASVVVLLFWIFLSASIMLLGAHLAAAIDYQDPRS